MSRWHDVGSLYTVIKQPIFDICTYIHFVCWLWKTTVIAFFRILHQKKCLSCYTEKKWLIKSWYPNVIIILRYIFPVQYIRFRPLACRVNEISPTGPRVAIICNNTQMSYDRSCARNVSALIHINVYVSHVSRAGLAVYVTMINKSAVSMQYDVRWTNKLSKFKYTWQDGV